MSSMGDVSSGLRVGKWTPNLQLRPQPVDEAVAAVVEEVGMETEAARVAEAEQPLVRPQQQRVHPRLLRCCGALGEGEKL